MSDLNDLNDFAEAGNNRFFSFDKEKELEAHFMSATKEQDRFGKPGDMWVHYAFKDINGNDREFNSKSKRLAKAMVEAGVKVGSLVRISRVGSGYETNYLVKVLPSPKGPVSAPIVDSEPEVKVEDIPDLPF